ncbi:TPA: hypothetical protein ACT5B2_000847 [Burkholderia cenocepacia]|uniref:hypothetical protein n=1 Tax=Burkholderia cenocepacia TaxID=95486 RepID=UPI002AB6006E|nr:hypothetical protein [Burkholderia cenocepacia]
MTHSTWWRCAWLFNRRVAMALLWSALVIGAAVAVNLAGIQAVGGIAKWERWLQTQAWVFLIWRIALYAATARGWWWMRQRVLRREPIAETRLRFLRLEIAAVTAIVLMEGSFWLRHG